MMAINGTPDIAEQISAAIIEPLADVMRGMAREIDNTNAKLADLDVYVRALERRLQRLEERVL